MDIETKGGRLEVSIYEKSGLVEITSPEHVNVGIFLERCDPTQPLVSEAKGTLYMIRTYIPNGENKNMPSEYGIAFIMPDGEIISRAGGYSKKIKNINCKV